MRFRFGLIFVMAGLLAGCSGKDKKQEPMAGLQQEAESPADVIKRLSSAIEKEPNNAALLAQRAKLYNDQKAYAAALTDLEKAISIDNTKPEYVFQKARAQRGLNRIEPAIKSVQEAEARGYKQADLYVLTGEILIILKQYQKAIDALNKALKIQPFNEAAYFYKGMVYAETGDTTRAISGFQTSFEQSPEFVDAYNELAKIHTAKKQYAEAEQYIQSGLRFQPENGFLHYNRGVNLVKQNYPDSAAFSFKEALKTDSAMYMAAYNLGVINYNANRYAEAIPYFEKSIRFNEKLPNIRLLLADSYDKAGRKEEALKQYNLVLKTVPADEFALRAVKRLNASASAN